MYTVDGSDPGPLSGVGLTPPPFQGGLSPESRPRNNTWRSTPYLVYLPDSRVSQLVPKGTIEHAARMNVSVAA